MYVQSSLESLIQFFSQTFTAALSQNSPLKKCFIRIDKNIFTVTDKRLTRKLRQLMFDRDKFLNAKDYEKLFDLKKKLIIYNDNDFNRLHRNFIEAVKNNRKSGC